MLNGPLNSILVLNNLGHAASTVAIDLDAALARLLWRGRLGLCGGFGLGNFTLVGELLLTECVFAVQIGGVAALLEGELVLRLLILELQRLLMLLVLQRQLMRLVLHFHVVLLRGLQD